MIGRAEKEPKIGFNEGLEAERQMAWLSVKFSCLANMNSQPI